MAERVVKPGKETTEFYAAVGTVIALVTMMSTGVPIPPDIGTAGIIAISLVYNIVRGWIKSR